MDLGKSSRDFMSQFLKEEIKPERLFTLQEALEIWDAALRWRDDEGFAKSWGVDNPDEEFDKKRYFKEKFNIDINP